MNNSYLDLKSKNLKKTIEPFEYDNRVITRIILINDRVPKTRKNTVSKYIIDTKYSKEIHDLKRSKSKKTGVISILTTNQVLQNFLLKILPLRFVTFRKVLLKIITNDKNLKS